MIFPDRASVKHTWHVKQGENYSVIIKKKYHLNVQRLKWYTVEIVAVYTAKFRFLLSKGKYVSVTCEHQMQNHLLINELEL